MGSAAAYFFMQRAEQRPFNGLLADTNLQLIKTFLEVRDKPQRVLEELAHLISGYQNTSNPREFYLTTRTNFNAVLPRVSAAQFIFLNRTCWNGLYRVNRSGKFNVPLGASRNGAVFPTEADILNAAASLVRADIKATSWRNTLAAARPNDFVFADPPYYSDCAVTDTKYSRFQFSMQDHIELAHSLARLARVGVDFLLTNSAEAEMIDLYKSLGFEVEPVDVPRYISSKVESRVAAKELIVRPAGQSLNRQLFLSDELAQVISAFQQDNDVITK